MNNLEEILELVQHIENSLVSDDLIPDDGYYHNVFEEIKEGLYKEMVKNKVV
jgi:hypothetical protein